MPLLLCKQTLHLNGCNTSKFHRCNSQACLSMEVQGAFPSQWKIVYQSASQNTKHFKTKLGFAKGKQ